MERWSVRFEDKLLQFIMGSSPEFLLNYFFLGFSFGARFLL
jgi:hypothetical protein